MVGTARRRIGFGVLTSLAVAGVVGVSSMSVSGVVPPPPTEATDPYPALRPLGKLTITIGDRNGTVTYQPAAFGSTPVTQVVRTVQPCNKVEFLPTSDLRTGDLITLTPMVNGTTGAFDTVQIPSDGMGVHSGSNCGTPAGLIGPKEKLSIGVGSYFGADVKATSADLVVGTTNQATGLIVEFGTEVQTTRTVPVGGTTFTAVKPLLPTVAAGPFRTITLSSDAYQNSRGVSVKSGTSLDLVFGGTFTTAVACGEVKTDVGAAGEIATRAQFYRGKNLSKQTSACSDVGVTVEIRPDKTTTSVDEASVFWDNGATGVNGLPQAVSGTVTVDWAAVSTPAELAREIDYDAEGAAFGWQPVVWCTSFATSADATNGILTFTVGRPNVTKTNIPLTMTDDVQVPAPWCLVSNSESLRNNPTSGVGEYLQTQVFYGQGDPQAR